MSVSASVTHISAISPISTDTTTKQSCTPPSDLIGNDTIFDPIRRQVILFGGKSQGSFQRTVRLYDLSNGLWDEYTCAIQHIVPYGNVSPLDNSHHRNFSTVNKTASSSSNNTDKKANSECVTTSHVKGTRKRQPRNSRKRTSPFSLFGWMRSMARSHDLLTDLDTLSPASSLTPSIVSDQNQKNTELKPSVFGLGIEETSSSHSRERSKSVIHIVEKDHIMVSPRIAPNVSLSDRIRMASVNSTLNHQIHSASSSNCFSLQNDPYACLHGNINLDRMYHTCNYIPELDKMIVFGGGGGEDNIFLNDVWQYDLRTREWRQLSPCIDVNHQKYPQKHVPMPRNLHSSCVRFIGHEHQEYDNDSDESDDSDDGQIHSGSPIYSIVIFGGWNGSLQSRYNDTFEFNIHSGTWRLLDPISRKQGPTHRSAHTANMISRDKMIVFGGKSAHSRLNDVWVYNLRELYWERIETTGAFPASRAGHASTVFQNGEKLLIQGGRDFNDNLILDTHVLHIRSKLWQRIDLSITPGSALSSNSGLEVLRRCFHRIIYLEHPAEFHEPTIAPSTDHQSFGSHQFIIVGGTLGAERPPVKNLFHPPVLLSFRLANKLGENSDIARQQNAIDLKESMFSMIHSISETPDTRVLLRNVSTHPMQTDGTRTYQHSLLLSLIPQVRDSIIAERNMNSAPRDSILAEITLDMAPDIFMSLMHTFSGGSCDSTYDLVIELLSTILYDFAEEITNPKSIFSLVAVCLRMMLPTLIDDSTVADILRLAIRIKMTDIIQQCYCYLMDNINQVIENDELIDKLPKDSIVELLRLKISTKRYERLHVPNRNEIEAAISDLNDAVAREMLKQMYAEVRVFESLEEATTWLQQSLCDLILQASGCNWYITVHRPFLMSRCQFFGAMLTHEFMESQSNCVSMEDMPSRVLHMVIQFLYGDTHIHVHCISDLLSLIRVANMIFLPSLQKEAIDLLHNMVSIETALQVLEFSLEFDIQSIRERCLTILEDNSTAREFAALMYAIDTEYVHPYN